jgi:hypothetical protein
MPHLAINMTSPWMWSSAKASALVWSEYRPTVQGESASNDCIQAVTNSGLLSASESEVRQCAGVPATRYAPPGVEFLKKEVNARIWAGVCLLSLNPNPLRDDAVEKMSRNNVPEGLRTPDGDHGFSTLS